jgi:RNA polymerase sigma-70 factor (ECF subfamily)
VSLALSDLSDGELATLGIAGRDAAFAEIMRRHREAVYRIALANIADPDEALDLTQETFVSAHLALRRYDGARPMRAWLAAIALNKCRDWARRRAVRRLFRFATPLDDVADVVADQSPDPERTAADRQAMRRLARAVAALPASLREPLVLHTIEGMSQAETAAVLSISEKAVETRLRRARIKLTEMLEG